MERLHIDEHGIMPAGVLRYENKVYLYYSGWSQRCSVPYTNLTGLAISEDNGKTFNKISKGPILGINMHEPYSATSPFVFFENNLFHMFYCSGTNWFKKNNKYEHTYDIKYSYSRDGINFYQDGKEIIKQKNIEEAITRPVILKKNNLYHMYFCFRGSNDFRDGRDAYRIGHAYSEDLKYWNRNDEETVIDLSKDGWDSRMLAYPYVIQTPYGTYLFYNGNGFGQSGFGYALLEE